MPYKQSKEAGRKAGFFLSGARVSPGRSPCPGEELSGGGPSPSPFSLPALPVCFLSSSSLSCRLCLGGTSPPIAGIGLLYGTAVLIAAGVCGGCMVRNMFTFLHVPVLICPCYDTCQECKKQHPVEESGTPCVLTNARQHCNQRLITCQVTLVCNATKHLLLSIVYILDK